MNHSTWKLSRRGQVAEGPKEAALRAELDAAWDLGQAVYDRRTTLGLSQRELAGRAGMTQAQISNIEGADSVPTLALLTRLAKALDAALTIDLDDERSSFAFRPHRAGGDNGEPHRDVA